MFDVCGSDDLDTSIVELEKEIDTLQNSKGLILIVKILSISQIDECKHY